MRETNPRTATPSLLCYDEERREWLTWEQWLAAQPISAFISDPNYLRKRAEEARRIAANEATEAESKARVKTRKKSLAEEEIMLGDNAFQAAVKPLSKAEARRRKKAEEREKMLIAAGQTTLAA